MQKDFSLNTYVVDSELGDTLKWLSLHQDCYDAFEFDVFSQQLKVHHANGTDILRQGMYLTAQYGILVTS